LKRRHNKRKSSYIACKQTMEYITGGTLLDAILWDQVDYIQCV